MKSNLVMAVIVLITAVSLYGFMPKQTSSISGKVIPADGAEKVWVIREMDSLSAKPVDGIFKLDVKPGWYVVIVQGKKPFKNVQFDKLEIAEGKSLDLGEIKMEK